MRMNKKLFNIVFFPNFVAGVILIYYSCADFDISLVKTNLLLVLWVIIAGIVYIDEKVRKL
jgi:hypothetical protein